jgi:hypothetical protein
LTEKREQQTDVIVPVTINVVFVAPPARDENGVIIDVQKS